MWFGSFMASLSRLTSLTDGALTSAARVEMIDIYYAFPLDVLTIGRSRGFFLPSLQP